MALAEANLLYIIYIAKLETQVRLYNTLALPVIINYVQDWNVDIQKAKGTKAPNVEGEFSQKN